jgi:hypothetical protein
LQVELLEGSDLGQERRRQVLDFVPSYIELLQSPELAKLGRGRERRKRREENRMSMRALKSVSYAQGGGTVPSQEER